MTATISEQIIDAIATDIAALPTVAASYRSRADAFSRRESGSVVVEPGRSDPQEVSLCTLRWNDEILIGIYTCGEIPDQLADPIRRDIHAAVMAARQPLQIAGITIADVTAGTVTRELDEGDKTAMWTLCRFTVTYHTSIDDLTAAS